MKQKHEGELLTAFMQEKHLSNYKLAQMMGVYGSAVKYWQKLEHIPDDRRDALIQLGLKIEPSTKSVPAGHMGHELRKYMKEKGIKVVDLAERLGVRSQQLSNYFAIASYSADFMAKLRAAGIPIGVSDTAIAVEGAESSRVVHAQAYGGYLSGHNDTNYIKGLPEQYIYVDEPGNYRTFEIKGDSMEPDFPDGCLVDAKQLDPTHWKKLHPGRVFVFLHREMGLQVKLLMKQTGSKCVFRCINDYYPDFEIDLTDVLEVWYFVQKHDRNRDYSRYLVR